MKITAIFILFLVCLPVLFSDEAEELPQTPTEIKLYSSGEFQSGVCKSPNLSSPAPRWKFNNVLLNNDEINTLYGVVVTRDIDHEGYHLSNITIPAVNLTLNNSTISCWVGSMVIVYYHMTVVEADLVYLSTEEFSSDFCESPSSTSRMAPHFMFNNISLNSNTANKFYRAIVTRGSSLDGRHQANLTLTALGSTLNGSTVTCLINHSTVIWKVYLITNESKGTPRTTTAAMETNQTTDGINQTHIVSESAGLSEELEMLVIPTVSCALLLVLVAVIVSIIIVVACVYKRGKPEHRNDDSSVDGPPDGESQVPPPRSVTATPIIPQVPDTESHGPSVVTDEPVIVVAGSRRSPRHQSVSSLLRHSDKNIGCSMMDPADLSALDSTTLRPLSNSFSVEPGQDESEILKLSREEESSTQGQSLRVPCINGVNYKNVYKSFVKGWDDSSRQCQYIADGMSDEPMANNDGKQVYVSAV